MKIFVTRVAWLHLAAAALLVSLPSWLEAARDARTRSSLYPRKKEARQSAWQTASLAGPTGLVCMPSAYLSTLAASWRESGQTVTQLNFAASGIEFGGLRRDDDWSSHLKLRLVNEVDANDYSRPAFAVGYWGAGGGGDPKTYYAVLSKRDPDAAVALHWGLTRLAVGGGTAPFYGVDMVLSPTFRFKGEFDHRHDVWNLGLEYVISYNLTAFRYQLDARHHASSTATDRDVSGLCYRTTF